MLFNSYIFILAFLHTLRIVKKQARLFVKLLEPGNHLIAIHEKSSFITIGIQNNIIIFCGYENVKREF